MLCYQQASFVYVSVVELPTIKPFDCHKMVFLHQQGVSQRAKNFACLTFCGGIKGLREKDAGGSTVEAGASTWEFTN